MIPLRSEPAWPHQLLDVAGLRAEGWRPTPFRDFVLKVHQRCNLACTYCYVYEMADQTWRGRPMVMPEHVVEAAAGRIGEHAREHRLDRVNLILHGGEPLLAGRDRLRSAVRTLRAALPPGCTASVGLQTNGTLVDKAILGDFRELGVSVGVSLDGPPALHDRHRRYANGRGSFAEVHRALTLLAEPARRDVYAGLLCTIDPQTDPVACYETLLSYAPPAIDFLLPHANWEEPPRRGPGATPYADWLIEIFDRWYKASPQPVRIRLFESLLHLAVGGSSRSEQVGLSPVALAVIETDGAIEQVDSLKSAYEGACATGYSVLTDPLGAALGHPGIVARQIGMRALADACQACPVGAACGGGHYAHRYRRADGFRNPSVYCADLMRLIRHVDTQVRADLAELSEAYAR
ncbi:hypothetical protein Ade02nite_31020 [Paractinoplanes deccanensis]|uniref:Radical SAM core domain-containing protein n=1 Tax=Paractinoplanes deccanensis TaxID=113561 RepID=A0ABQ3Y396_9ACTN|nr:FxsB family cyclophane-forming radical SAM/SPASM peptide maturase [Actinoplanes deccanensis]GID74461.1 hypothetical protein Ade02nite_31020 [Actinoplanes deccanensis]